MLGRTDSRRRLLILLVDVRRRVVGARRPDGVLAGRPGAELTGKAAPRPRSRMEIPSRRGEIYDRTGTVLLATTVERDRLVAAPRRADSEAARRDR